MKVLVVGSGGREHALAWAFDQSPSVEEVWAAPGNPGIADCAACVELDIADLDTVAGWAADNAVDLVVVGPEVPLVAGLVDACEARRIPAFGPRADGARLEGSKSWMKEILVAAGVPTARHATFTVGQEEAADAFLDTLPGLYVVKTDGLAAGKGVVVTESIAEAREAVRAYLSGDAFGSAGTTLVIEEGLSGPELSLLVLTDGETAVPLAPAQDFKRVGNGDAGPNTGGMGAYSPVPAVDAGVVADVMASAVEPTLATLRSRGVTYRGVLYAGLMLTPDGPKVLEYNVRFGDPEAQVVIPRLASDLATHCRESAEGWLRTEVRWHHDAAVTVVLAAQDYPASPRTGDPIEGLDDVADLPGVVVFHAGTRREGDKIVTAGGRVLNVTALAPSIGEARQRAYDAIRRISWDGMHHRTDIAGTVAV
ncbi:MAG TPA: phosphoribosylamine--glycine ligase [Acidimicrobiia bacterium]|nr:phosphoribosylamine--glycine ligase [Acidimicrobiia bacterium]